MLLPGNLDPHEMPQQPRVLDDPAQIFLHQRKRYDCCEKHDHHLRVDRAHRRDWTLGLAPRCHQSKGMGQGTGEANLSRGRLSRASLLRRVQSHQRHLLQQRDDTARGV